jgi:hypothetical protein
MNLNPYESPREECGERLKVKRRMRTDWFSLVGLFVGSVAAVFVGMVIRSEQAAIGESRGWWLLVGSVATVGVIAMSGRVLGWLVRRSG